MAVYKTMIGVYISENVQSSQISELELNISIASCEGDC